MTQQNERLPAFGNSELDPQDQPDFANEHGDTAVSPDVIDNDDSGEPESPRGWSGMKKDGPV
ncbi:hypothetical protein ACPCHT_31610 [Nucisporomicrobium flavum]|uniref:hypothetical protein n=1 Tax=Nucisporomicrobium flavum TaxID=2785915 RepID=UPI003C309DE5